MTIWELIALAKSSGGGGHIDASLFKFKGSVFTTDDLPDTAENGDVYHVDADGGEYVWVEDYWESLGATIDLSAYRTAAEQNTIDALKAPLASPTLSGTPTAPTAPAGTNTQQIATTEFVQNACTAITNAQIDALFS